MRVGREAEVRALENNAREDMTLPMLASGPAILDGTGMASILSKTSGVWLLNQRVGLEVLAALLTATLYMAPPSCHKVAGSMPLSLAAMPISRRDSRLLAPRLSLGRVNDGGGDHCPGPQTESSWRTNPSLRRSPSGDEMLV